MAAVRYRNKKTGKIATYARAMPRLERSATWEKVDQAETKKKPASNGS